MLIVRIVALLAFGVMLGGIIGAIVTGDWRYTIVWAVAMSVAIVGLIISGLALANAAAAGKDATRTAARRGRTIAIACIVVVLPAVVTLIPSFGSIARIGTNQSMLTGSYQPQAMDDIAKVVGTHDLVDVDFYDSYIIVEAPTKPGASTTDDYQYRYGHAERLGPEMIQPDRTKTAEYDGRTVNWAVIPKLITDAEHRSKITGPTTLHVSVMQSLDPKVGHPPIITVNVEDSYHDAFVEYSPQGKFLSESGSAFDLG